MIETVMTAQMPVGLPIKIKKNRLEPDTIQENMPRLSIVAGVHGDELQGQYICYELIRRIKEEREKDVYKRQVSQSMRFLLILLRIIYC